MAAIPVTTGLQLLLDARTIAGLADGDKVAAWADQSGQGNNAAQATEASKPTYKTNIYGSNPAVRIADSGDYIHGTIAAWGTPIGYTMLACINNVPSSQHASGRHLSVSGNSTSDFQSAIVYSPTTAGAVAYYQNSVAMTMSPNLVTASLGSPVVVGFASHATAVDIVVNSVIRSSIAHAAGLGTTPTKYSSGYIASGVVSDLYGACCDIHFLAIFNGRLSAADINSVSEWMLLELGAIEAGGTSRPLSPFTQQVIG